MVLWLSTNSSNIDIFSQNKLEYKAALKNSGYKAKLVLKSRDEAEDVCNRNNRTGNILYLTPSSNMAVSHKIGKDFFFIFKEKLLSVE